MQQRYFVAHILCKVTSGNWHASEINEALTRFAGGELTRDDLARSGLALLDAADPMPVLPGDGWHDECTDGSHDDIPHTETSGWHNN